MSQFTERELAQMMSSMTGSQMTERERERMARRKLKRRLGSQFTEREYQNFMNSSYNPFRRG